MQKPISRLEEAFRDTTVHKVEGSQIDDQGSLLGLNRPDWVVRSKWRDVLHKTAYCPRGVSKTLYQFLRFGLQQLNETYTVTVDANTPAASVQANTASFSNRHVGRLCVLKDSNGEEKILYTVSDTTFLNFQVNLKFAQTATAMFDAAPAAFESGTYTLTVLPFLVQELSPSVVYKEIEKVEGGETGGKLSIPQYFLGQKKHGAFILIRLFDTGFKVPGTFVQKLEKNKPEPVDLEPFIPPAEVGGPTGGYMQENVLADQYNDGNATFPIYLGEGLKNANLLLDVLRQNFLAAGVRVEFELFTLSDFD